MKKVALLMLILLQIISSLQASDGAMTAVEKFQIAASKSVNKPEWSYLVTYVDDYTLQGGHIAPNSQLSIFNPSDLVEYKKLFTVNYQTNYFYPVKISIGLKPFISDSESSSTPSIAVTAKFDKSISFSPSSIGDNYSSVVSVGEPDSEEVDVVDSSSVVEKPFSPVLGKLAYTAVMNGSEPASMTYSIATSVKFINDGSLDLNNLDSSYTMNVTIKVEVDQ